MSGFKLLAIRPLEGCSEKYRKLLKVNTIYKFYNNYSFLNKDGKVVSENETVYEIIENPNSIESLYNIDRGGKKPLFVNISAIVGKNGSGKSSLLELLFLATYVVGICTDKLSGTEEFEDRINYYKTKIKELNENNLRKGNKAKWVYDKIDEYEHNVNRLTKEIKEIHDIFDTLRLEIYYSFDDAIYCLQINSTAKVFKINKDKREIREVKLQRILGEKDSENIIALENFFYCIAINYSAHGLNSRALGKWIRTLFHKNDAYQTPIVLNPYRENGNFDINEENYFAQSRLLANLVDDSMIVKNVIENKLVHKIDFILDVEKIKLFKDEYDLDLVIETVLRTNSLKIQDLFEKIYYAFFQEKIDYNFKKNNIKHFAEIEKYTIKKIIKIAAIYKDYKDYYESSVEENIPPTINYIDGYLQKLSSDNSHITLKLKQILNLVRFDILSEMEEDKIKWENGTITLKLDQLIERIKVIKKTNPEIPYIELVPVAFFNPRIYIISKRYEKDFNSTKFTLLSSGELQQIHSIQAIIYHLLNLNSVFNSIDLDKEKKTFPFVNIILDEIEICFHPDLQRKLVLELLNSIKNLNIPNIKGINFIFSTHSPFILSDIPSSNILRLRDGNPEPIDKSSETFGANIYDLLKSDFFMENYIGEFSKSQIVNYLEWINDPNRDMNLKTMYENLIKIVGDPIVKKRMDILFSKKIKSISYEQLLKRNSELEQENIRLKKSN